MKIDIESYQKRHADLVRIESKIQALRPAADAQDAQRRELQARLDAALKDTGDAMEVGAEISGLQAGLAVVNRRFAAAEDAWRKERPLLVENFQAVARQLARDLEVMNKARYDAHREEWLRVGRLHTPGLQEQDYHRHLQLHGGEIFYAWTNCVPRGSASDFDDDRRARFLKLTVDHIAALFKEAIAAGEAKPALQAAA